MIIGDQNEVTVAVLEAIEKTPDPRLREILTVMIKHLHGFIREARLSEEEFQQACNFIVRLGQKSDASHNEVVLMAGSLGVSSLVCLLNNGNKGQTETSASMLGPFWRLNSPVTENGGSIVRSPTPGPALFADSVVVDGNGAPIAGCGRRRVAILDRRAVRESGSEPGRHEFARPVPHRRARQVRVPHHSAGRLSDTGRRSGGRLHPRREEAA